MTFDLGRVTTEPKEQRLVSKDCGDVRSRTSYNSYLKSRLAVPKIAVTFDLGRVTTITIFSSPNLFHIAVTFDLGRVTT